MTIHGLPYSEACERNKGFILPILQAHLINAKTVLEIGSGTAQHAVHFAKNLPHLIWQTTDQAMYLQGVQAQVQHAELANLIAPFELDVSQPDLLEHALSSTSQTQQKFDVLYTANTFHIMSWRHVESLFESISDVLSPQAKLVVYGPFKYQGEFTTDSNQQFDQMLKQRDPLSGIRDFEKVNALAEQQGLNLLEDTAMPANNQCIVWAKLG